MQVLSGSLNLTQSGKSSPRCSKRSSRLSAATVHCQNHQPLESSTVSKSTSIPNTNSAKVPTIPSIADRRAMLSFPLALAASQLLLLNSSTKPALAAGKSTATRTAADFLPASSTPGFVTYSPDERATPSIRAGVINPAYYSFDLPSNWNEGTILNIQSGNFCMPNCPEPWTESIWKSPAEGQCTLIVSQLSRLISKSNATLKDLGTPESLVERIGSYITNTYLDSEDVLNIQEKDGYYVYEVFAPYAKDHMDHNLAAFTVKKDLFYLFVVSANEKQWSKSEDILRHMVSSFKA